MKRVRTNSLLSGLQPRLMLPMALLLYASAVPVHAQAYIGRLFATPAERAALDATRGKATPQGATGAQAGAPYSALSDGPPPGLPGGAPIGLPAAAPAGLPGAVPGQIASQGAGQTAGAPDANLPMGSAQAGMAPGAGYSGPAGAGAGPAYPSGGAAPVAAGGSVSSGGAMPPGAMPPGAMPPGAMPYGGDAAGVPQAAAPVTPSSLVMNGVLRTSGGRSTIWLNNVPQNGARNQLTNRDKNAITVTLPSGKKILLKAGQRYDLTTGRIKDINEP
jgi:hypothetical protein